MNDIIMHYSEKNLPFGGVGESGMGAYHGKERENRVQSGRFKPYSNNFLGKTPFLAISTPYYMGHILCMQNNFWGNFLLYLK